MKHLQNILAVFAALITISASAQFTNQYDTLQIADGTVYENARPQRAEHNALVVFHSGGIANIPFSALPTNIVADLSLLPTETRGDSSTTATPLSFNVSHMITKKVSGGRLSGPYDYWIDIYNLNLSSFVGLIEVQPLNSSRDGITPSSKTLPISIPSQQHSQVKINSSVAPSFLGAHGEYSIRGFDIKIADRSKNVVFRKRIPTSRQFEDTTKY